MAQQGNSARKKKRKKKSLRGRRKDYQGDRSRMENGSEITTKVIDLVKLIELL
jgi:hypothetical protein